MTSAAAPVRTDPDLLAAVGPRVRKSPFFDATVAAGVHSVTTYNHMWLPMGYGDAHAEYRRLTETVSMWDVAAQRHIEVSGPDADELVQMSTVVDVSGVERGGGCYAPMVDGSGVLINDPVLLRFDDGSWRFSIADSDIRLWLAALVDARSLRCTVRELPTATLAVQGPHADNVLAAAGLHWVRDLEDFERRRSELADIPVMVSRSGWSNQGGVELFLDAVVHSLELWTLIADLGEPFGIGPGAPDPAERIESTLLSYGTDTGYDASPLEVGLDSIVELDGPEFIGRRALCEERDRGPSRRLSGAVIEGEPMHVLPHPCPIESADGTVGEVRAAAWSPRFGVNLGLALVSARAETGAEGGVLTPDGHRRFRLVDLPFTADGVSAAALPRAR